MFDGNDKSFCSEFLEKVVKKLSVISRKIGANFPSTNSRTGKFDPKENNDKLASWTNGFWPGMMWLMYIKTGDEYCRKIAEECEEKLDEAFDIFFGLHHDVGFMWELSALADYKITKNERSRARALHAATILAGRYNPNAGMIRAWDHASSRAIIDCMMNIPLLYWASKETDDPRFGYIADCHVESVMKHFIRGDGSVHHQVVFDPETGEILEKPQGQGAAPGSSWSRGQAWAIYGFALAYLNTGNTDYLDVSKSVAHYFIANIEDGELPLLDFRAPEDKKYFDASAAAIAACGLIELAKAVGELEKKIYENAAMKLLRALYKDFDESEDNLWLLNKCSASWRVPTSIHIPYVFGDYYLLEALMKIDGNDGSFTVHG